MSVGQSPAYSSEENEGPGQPMSLSGLGAGAGTTAFSPREGICCCCGRWQEEGAIKAQLCMEH